MPPRMKCTGMEGVAFVMGLSKKVFRGQSGVERNGSACQCSFSRVHTYISQMVIGLALMCSTAATTAVVSPCAIHDFSSVVRPHTWLPHSSFTRRYRKTQKTDRADSATRLQLSRVIEPSPRKYDTATFAPVSG